MSSPPVQRGDNNCEKPPRRPHTHPNLSQHGSSSLFTEIPSRARVAGSHANSSPVSSVFAETVRLPLKLELEFEFSFRPTTAALISDQNHRDYQLDFNNFGGAYFTNCWRSIPPLFFTAAKVSSLQEVSFVLRAFPLIFFFFFIFNYHQQHYGSSSFFSLFLGTFLIFFQALSSFFFPLSVLFDSLISLKSETSEPRSFVWFREQSFEPRFCPSFTHDVSLSLFFRRELFESVDKVTPRPAQRREFG